MLSRTADHLYWMARYTERAENLARLLDVTHQMSLVPQSVAAENQNWGAILALNSLETQFAEAYDEVTAETWESCNATWIEVRGQKFEQILSAGVGEFFEWVKLRSAVTSGVTFGTMLQDDALHFIRLGGLIERGDNTARILDVKYHGLHTHGDEDASDFYQWGALLRSLSAFEVYRKVYRHAITPAKVAELLMLRLDMPRSLLACASRIVHVLTAITNAQSAETERQAGVLYSHIRYARIDDILAQGLHEYLTDFMDHIYELGAGISRDFLVAA